MGGYIYSILSTPVLYYFSPAVYITIDRSIVEGSGLPGIVPACVC